MLEGDEDSDTLIGLAGIDTASYIDHESDVVATLDGVKNDGTAAKSEVDWIKSDVENLIGGNGNPTQVRAVNLRRAR